MSKLNLKRAYLLTFVLNLEEVPRQGQGLCFTGQERVGRPVFSLIRDVHPCRAVPTLLIGLDLFDDGVDDDDGDDEDND